MLAVASVLFVGMNGPLSATDRSDPTGSLSGYVTDTQMNPLPGARVRVYFHETYEENYSNATGYYHVTNIPLCYCLKNATCLKAGYEPQWVLLSISENTIYDFTLTELSQDPYPLLNGTMGEGGWYRSCVNITFLNIQNVDALFYHVDGCSWTEYTGAFSVCESGGHQLSWYWIAQGNTSGIQTLSFKVDREDPTLQLSYQRMSISTLKVNAEAIDGHSGMDRVEFFLDDVHQYSDDTEPYETLMIGIGVHHVKAVAYDRAGNSMNSTVITSYFLRSSLPFPGLSFFWFLVLFFLRHTC